MATITPWEVKGNIDYDTVIQDFGVQKISPALLKRLEQYAQKKGLALHKHLRRGIFFAHRELEWVLDEYDKGNPFFLYTGRSPSGPIHLGHIQAWQFTKWLQDVFDAELWFQFPDEEKFLFSKEISLQDTAHWLEENMRDVIALGFRPEKTHFIINTRHAKLLYPTALEIAKKITYNKVRSTFGFTDEQNIGAIFYTAMQSVPAVLPSVLQQKNIPCLIPHAIDQDPHFRVTREALHKLGFYKPASIQCRFMPGLGGIRDDGKMSSSKEQTAIYTTDSPEQAKKKIQKYAFSGGAPTKEEHELYGGNPDIDTAYQWLTFLEEDDSVLEQLRNGYLQGTILSGQMKQECIARVQDFLHIHALRREHAQENATRYIFNHS